MPAFVNTLLAIVPLPPDPNPATFARTPQLVQSRIGSLHTVSEVTFRNSNLDEQCSQFILKADSPNPIIDAIHKLDRLQFGSIGKWRDQANTRQSYAIHSKNSATSRKSHHYIAL